MMALIERCDWRLSQAWPFLEPLAGFATSKASMIWHDLTSYCFWFVFTDNKKPNASTQASCLEQALTLLVCVHTCRVLSWWLWGSLRSRQDGCLQLASRIKRPKKRKSILNSSQHSKVANPRGNAPSAKGRECGLLTKKVKHCIRFATN